MSGTDIIPTYQLPVTRSNWCHHFTRPSASYT